MSGQSFRFLHTGSFHLESTLQGLFDVPEDLTELLVEAPYRSAANAFAAAIREEVDFVVLSGDLLNPATAGPRAIVFLQEQFTELAQRQIPVYWSASELDLTGGFLRAVEWPENVKILRSDLVEQFEHRRGELRVANIAGRSWVGENASRSPAGSTDDNGLFRLAILPSMLDVGSSSLEADYWAIGGDESGTPVSGECIVHCPGMPQGLRAEDTSAHGCSLVQASADRQIRSRRIRTESFSWKRESLPVAASTSRGEIRGQCKKRLKQLASEVECPVLVNWQLIGNDRFDSVMALESERQDLLHWLREEFGLQRCPVWSASLEMEPIERLPDEWFEEDSILGDYLRVVRKYFLEPDKSLDLEVETGDDPIPQEIVRTLDFSDRKRRNQVLHEAAVMGTDLLRGDDRSGDGNS